MWDYWAGVVNAMSGFGHFLVSAASHGLMVEL